MKRSRRKLAGRQKSDAPRRVWLVYQEFQADTPDIVGLYSKRWHAEQVAEECRRSTRGTYGWVVYGDTDVHGHDIVEWDVDVHVEGHPVQPASGRPERHDP